jgi:hypothetical protein
MKEGRYYNAVSMQVSKLPTSPPLLPLPPISISLAQMSSLRSVAHNLFLSPPIQPIHPHSILNRQSISIPEHAICIPICTSIPHTTRKRTLILVSPPLLPIPIRILLELPINLLCKDWQADCAVVLSAGWGKEPVHGGGAGCAVLETVHAAYACRLLVTYLALLWDIERVEARR